MTTERRRALIMMAATFVIGILIGVLATGFFARSFYRGHKSSERRENPYRSRGNFVQKIFQVVDADDAQKEAAKPIVEATMARIDAMQQQGEISAKAAMDSMKIKLSTILRPEQLERLEKFISKKRGRQDGEKAKEEKHEHEQ